jgi:hypothetical protein
MRLARGPLEHVEKLLAQIFLSGDQGFYCANAAFVGGTGERRVDPRPALVR